MSNYVKAVDFSAKDALASGNPNKIIKGQEINDEYNAIATAIGTKADLASPALLGNPTAVTQPSGNSSTRLATTAFVASALATSVYPIGSIYLNATNSTNPATLLGFGTWVAFGAGRMPIGFNGADPLFDSAEETGGSKDAVIVSHTHTGSTASGGSHTHLINNSLIQGQQDNGSTYLSRFDNTNEFQLGDNDSVPNIGTTSTHSGHTHDVTVNASGSSGTNANLPPYITVYMWKRTA